MDADTLLHQTVVRLRAHEGKYAEIARQSPDIGYSWLTKVAHGQITNPTIASLQQLIEALDAFEGFPPREVVEPAASRLEAGSGDVDLDRIVPLETA